VRCRRGHTLDLIFFLLGLCFLTALPGRAAAYTREDIKAFYDYSPGQPLEATAELVEQTLLHRQYHVTFKSIHGETVPALLTVPIGLFPWTKWPCIVYLHGYGMDKEMQGWVADLLAIIEFLSLEDRYAIMAIDAQYHGEREEYGRDVFSLNFLQDRNALAGTVIDNRRAIDYLLTRDDIQPQQIHVLGISMGGILGGLLASVDDRVKATSLIVGGGDWATLVSESDLEPAGPMREALNGHYEMIPAWFDPVDPVNTAQLISPRALQMHNGLYDTTVPTGQELFDAALEPKEIYWYPADHFGITRHAWDIITRSLDWFGRY
jgi:cephalosporin-C deacetylase-like acetyl esterase